jgi:hypothetical protein
MNVDPDNGIPEPVTAQSERRYSFKSAGRAAFMKRLNEEGRGGTGGRRPTHGRRALAELVRRGEELDGPIGELTRDLETAYAADYGGDLSTAEKGLVRRLVMLDVDLALLIAERDKAARFSKADAMNHAAAVSRNCAAFSGLLKVMGGPGRRQREADRAIVIRRAYEPTPTPADPGSAEEQTTDPEAGQ